MHKTAINIFDFEIIAAETNTSTSLIYVYLESFNKQNHKIVKQNELNKIELNRLNH